MTLREAAIHEWSLVVLKPFGDRQTLRQRLFRIGGWLSPGAREAEIGVWPGYAIFGTYVIDGAWNGQSTADIERLATDEDLRTES
jgi:hypothetical protein